MNKPRIVRCPQCGKDSLWAPENAWRPFCSERCKQIDLGAWATGSYAIPGQPTDAETAALGADFQENQR
jgi:hypothetical protein